MNKYYKKTKTDELIALCKLYLLTDGFSVDPLYIYESERVKFTQLPVETVSLVKDLLHYLKTNDF